MVIDGRLWTTEVTPPAGGLRLTRQPIDGVVRVVDAPHRIGDLDEPTHCQLPESA
jgi:hypothetical protein